MSDCDLNKLFKIRCKLDEQGDIVFVVKNLKTGKVNASRTIPVRCCRLKDQSMDAIIGQIAEALIAAMMASELKDQVLKAADVAVDAIMAYERSKE